MGELRLQFGQFVTMVNADPGGPIGPPGILSWLIGDHRDMAYTLGMNLASNAGYIHRSIHGLATSHCHRIVVKDFVSDIYPSGNTRSYRK